MRQDVNYIVHQKQVYLKLIEDQNIRTSHIAIYNALFMIWNGCGFDSELSINRNDVMKLSKIGNANTYTKCLKELHSYGYIIYKPSNNPLVGSLVTIIRCDKSSDNSTDNGSVKSSSKGTDKGSGEGGDTLYKLSKQLNNKTIKLINNNVSLVNDNIEKWVNQKEEKEALQFPFDSERFYAQWDIWKEYKKKEHKFNFKTTVTEQASLFDLNKKSNGIEDVAIQIIHQSIANGWKGFFELKQNNNGKSRNDQVAQRFKELDPNWDKY